MRSMPIVSCTASRTTAFFSSLSEAQIVMDSLPAGRPATACPPAVACAGKARWIRIRAAIREQRVVVGLTGNSVFFRDMDRFRIQETAWADHAKAGIIHLSA